MQSEPLNAVEHFKLVVFLLLFIPTVPYFIGIIPALFLVFGYFMMKKNHDFSSVEASVKAIAIYCNLIIVIGVLVTIVGAVCYALLHNGVSYFLGMSTYDLEDLSYLALGGPIIAVMACALIILVKLLYLKPLRNHSEWVTVNGTFSSTPKVPLPENSKTGVDILQSEKLKPYSVADELLKWAKLKEDGLISEEEFSEARSKLLNRS